MVRALCAARREENEMVRDLTDLTQMHLSRRTVLQGAVAAAVTLPLAHQLASAQATKKLTIAFSVPGLNFPFFVHMMDLAASHAQQLGNIDFIKLDGQENGQPSSTKQSADLEDMVAKKVDGIVISPNDVNALAPAIQAAIDAGVPVVTVDRNVTGAKTLAHVGADNVKGGELQGQFLVQVLPNGGDIFELEGQSGASPAIDRHKGLHNVLDKQTAIKVTFDQTAKFDRATALSVTESALQKSQPAAIVCANDDMAFGAEEAAGAANVNVPIVGYDALPEALIAIRDGKQAATIEQFPGQQASQALDILVDHLRNGKEPAQHDNFLTPVLITKANLTQAERAVEAGISGVASPAASPAS